MRQEAPEPRTEPTEYDEHEDTYKLHDSDFSGRTTPRMRCRWSGRGDGGLDDLAA